MGCSKTTSDGIQHLWAPDNESMKVSRQWNSRRTSALNLGLLIFTDFPLNITDNVNQSASAFEFDMRDK